MPVTSMKKSETSAMPKTCSRSGEGRRGAGRGGGHVSGGNQGGLQPRHHVSVKRIASRRHTAPLPRAATPCQQAGRCEHQVLWVLHRMVSQVLVR